MIRNYYQKNILDYFYTNDLNNFENQVILFNL